MADPIGTIGTAVGLVSFGLQLYSTLDEYVRAIKAREDEISSASNTVQVITKQIQAIVDTLAKLPSDYQNGDHVEGISSALREWQSEKQSLINVLARLQSKSGNFAKTKAKALHPFRRKDLVDVKERLDSLIKRLVLSLQVLGMSVMSCYCHLS